MTIYGPPGQMKTKIIIDEAKRQGFDVETIVLKRSKDEKPVIIFWEELEAVNEAITKKE